MPFSITDYRNIPSTGVLPAALVPADQISFGYTFIYHKDIDLSAGLQSTLSGQVVLELKDAGGNLKATFDLRETYRITLLGGPGLVFFAWNWDSNKEQFSATDANGAPISTEGEFSLGVIPAGDSGTSNRGADVGSTFYSFIFNIDVNEGDVLKIKKHTLSAGSVVSQASLKVATRLGASHSPALVDEQVGQQFRVAGDSKGARMVRSRRLNSPIAASNTEWTKGEEGLIFAKPLNGAHMAQTEGKSLYVLGTQANEIRMFGSQDEGKSWQQIMSAPTNIKILASCLAKGGRYIAYGVDGNQKPSYVILKNGKDTWTVSESGLCTTPVPTTTNSTATTLPTNRVNTLEEGEGGMLRLLATDSKGALLLFLSRDGKEWESAPTGE